MTRVCPVPVQTWAGRRRTRPSFSPAAPQSFGKARRHTCGKPTRQCTPLRQHDGQKRSSAPRGAHVTPWWVGRSAGWCAGRELVELHDVSNMPGKHVATSCHTLHNNVSRCTTWAERVACCTAMSHVAPHGAEEVALRRAMCGGRVSTRHIARMSVARPGCVHTTQRRQRPLASPCGHSWRRRALC